MQLRKTTEVPMLRLRTLGRLELEGAPAPAAQALLQGPKRAGLLVYLACAQPPGLKRRDSLLALFWPRLDEARARHALRNTLHSLRGALGAEFFSPAGAEAVGILGGLISSDAMEFRQALADGRFEDAVALYEGEFLSGFFLSGTKEFEDWLETERKHLRRAYHAALERLAEAANGRREWTVAVQWWRLLADAEPSNGRLTLQLMQAMDAAGDRAGALRQAAHHAEVLRRDLDTEPDADVVAMVERFRSEPVSTPQKDSAPNSGATGTESSDRRPADIVSETTHEAARARSSLASFGLFGLLLLLGSLTLVRPRHLDSAVLDPQRVVVAPFENRTGDPSLDPAGAMAADWIVQGLLRTALVDVTTATATLASSQQMRAAMNAKPDVDPIRALAEETGAGLVVSGAFYEQGDSLLFCAYITDARRRVVVRTLGPVSGPAKRPLVAIELLRPRVLALLAPLLDTRLAAEAGVSSPPPTYEAYRAYAEGMDLFIASDWRASIARFQEAIALDSSYLPPSLLIAIAHYDLLEPAQADSIAKLLMRSRDRLGAYDRALLDLLMAWLGDDPNAPYVAAKRAAAIAPGSVLNVQWGAEALWLNRPREAIAILNDVDPTRGDVRGWQLYWWTLATAYHLIGDYRSELATAQRAREIMPDRSFWFLLEGRALAAMGRLDELEEVVDQRLSATTVRPAAPNAGVFMMQVADELRVHGHAAAARALAARAVEWYRSRSRDEQLRERPELAMLYLAEWRNQEARALFERLAKEEPNDLGYQAALGVLAARRGESVEALRIESWLGAQSRPYLRGMNHYLQACIAAEQRQPAQAMALLRGESGRGAGYLVLAHSDPCFAPIRPHPAFMELLRPTG
ncbi:MAG TPA: BTAD domain-containing putative transcriptional regulator [Gemmatimonadales bacterium]|nr:BTAD domain-containing putative transcriptional regulator [Gemmatimonadales bacterium]